MGQIDGKFNRFEFDFTQKMDRLLNRIDDLQGVTLGITESDNFSSTDSDKS